MGHCASEPLETLVKYLHFPIVIAKRPLLYLRDKRASLLGEVKWRGEQLSEVPEMRSR